MAAQYLVTTGSFALTAATAKIPIEFAPASTRDCILIGLDVTFDAPGTTDPFVEFCTYGTVGSGGSAPTLLKYGVNQDVAAQTVVRINDTTAPTTITQLFAWYTSGQQALLPLGRELQMQHSGKFCIRITAPASCNAVINALIEE